MQLRSVTLILSLLIRQCFPLRSNVKQENKKIQHSTTTSRKIQTPAIKEAKVRLECRLEQHIPLGGKDNVASTDLIIGKIVCYHVANEIYSDGKINPNALQAVSRLAGANYA